MGKVKYIDAVKGNQLKRKGYKKSMSIRVAKEKSGHNNIYKTPSGVYFWK